MFTMMNEARALVGMQGLSQAAAAYQVASAYARERLQGRAVTGAENPDGPADPLIVHPDVRRALMDQKAFVEGGRAFMLWSATLIDAHARAGDAAADGPRLAADPGGQGLPDRQGLREHGAGAADARRPWLHRGDGACRSSSATPGSR